MKNIVFILFLTVLSSSGCRNYTVNGQSNTELINSANSSRDTFLDQTIENTNVSGNDKNDAKNKVFAEGQTKEPFRQKIQILNAPKIQSSVEISAENGEENFSFWEKSLRWGNFCGGDSERITITFHQYAENRFVAEVMCSVGAYNFSYLFYDYTMRGTSATVKMMNFEYFLMSEKLKLERYITYNLYGEGGFNKDKNRLNFRYYSVGGGQCGWQNDYLIRNGKPILAQVTAQWNCEPTENGQDQRWKKMNLTSLRKKAGKIFFDRFDK